MKRRIFTLIAGSIALVLVAQPDIARADNGQVAAGVAGGLLGGMLLGSALAPRRHWRGLGSYRTAFNRRHQHITETKTAAPS
jgi:hypothetical protein